MLNYAVDTALLKPFVPAGTELDFFRGRAYLSMVGFEFKRVRVRGFRVPFHQEFEEVNLRFYVRRSSVRGVVFIRELVPRYAVAAVARLVYGENYSRVPMSHRIESSAGGEPVAAEYTWRSGRERFRMRIETEGAGFIPADGSEEQFITEHYWGYAAQPGGACLEYEVQHPVWQVWRAKQAVFAGDAALLYGTEIAQVLRHAPDSAFLALGSPVTVFSGTRIS
jgi:uncharacterized protein YqjF (DUF2071 family)